MANAVDYTISGITRVGPVVANTTTVTFHLMFVDKSITYPDGTVADWLHEGDYGPISGVDVSGATLAAKQLSAQTWLAGYVETKIIPQLRANRFPSNSPAGTSAPDVTVLNKVV